MTLPRYSASEAAAVNWLVSALPGAEWWTERLNEGLGPFFERPAGIEVVLHARNSMDPAEPEKTLTFKKDEILFGREEGNDVPVPVRSAGKRHARIRVENGDCLIEDLGTAIGTYVNRARLAPSVPRPLSTGDEIAIFPYVFSVKTNPAWEREADIGITPGGTAPGSWDEFTSSGAWDAALVPVSVSGATEPAWVEAGGRFLDELFRRIVEPLGAARSHLGAGAFDSGLAELLVVSVAERVNSALGCPLELAGGAVHRPAPRGSGRGVAISLTARVGASCGVVRLWLPFSWVAALRESGCRKASREDCPASWRLLVSRGYVLLSAQEMAGLERNDVVLIDADPALLLPGNPERGFRLDLEGGNFARARLDKYFEREPLANDDTVSAESPILRSTPDLSLLPVRLHVIVGEKEMTLAEANGLAPGSVLDLDLPPGPARLAVNGRIIGEGELVEIDGRLGVRVTGWRGA